MRITYLDNRPDEVVEEEHFRVKFGDIWDDPWKMEVDLTEMCEDAGKKVKVLYTDNTVFDGVDYPVTRFKKVLKLIRRHADEDTQEEVQQYLDEHFPRWAKEFMKLR